jgi:HEAT repeat protein
MVSKAKKGSKAPINVKKDTAHVDTTISSENPTGKTVDQLIKALKDPDEIVRSTAAGALGHTGSKKAVAPLIRALKDTHVYVRHGAAWALGEIRAEEAIDALRMALNDPDEITRGKAAEALGKIQGY